MTAATRLKSKQNTDADPVCIGVFSHRLVLGDVMKKQAWQYAGWILLSEAVGLLSAWLTRGNMDLYTQQIVQPPLSPPAIVFPIVWTILYALMGVGAARVSLSEDSLARDWALTIFIAQLAVNFFWSLFFFNAQAFGFSYLWLLLLVALVAVMVYLFWRVDPLAGILQLPYLLWVIFASYLNLGVWLMNRA